MKEASKEFFDAMGGGMGSPSISCSCGRRHFAPDGMDVSETEAMGMREDAATDKHVVLHENEDAVHAVTINGMVCVHGCECNYPAKLENLFWNMRDRILDYYRRRREVDAQALASLDDALQSTNEVKSK